MILTGRPDDGTMDPEPRGSRSTTSPTPTAPRSCPEEYPYVRALAGHEVVSEPFHVRRPSAPGHQVIEISAYPLPEEPGTPPRAMLVVRDVTSRPPTASRSSPSRARSPTT